MHCYLCLFRISLLDKVFSDCFRQAFFIWETLVLLGRWLSCTVIIVQEFALVDSASIVLDKWLPYIGGWLNRFDCNALS